MYRILVVITSIHRARSKQYHSLAGSDNFRLRLDRSLKRLRNAFLSVVSHILGLLLTKSRCFLVFFFFLAANDKVYCYLRAP